VIETTRGLGIQSPLAPVPATVLGASEVTRLSWPIGCTFPAPYEGMRLKKSLDFLEPLNYESPVPV